MFCSVLPTWELGLGPWERRGIPRPRALVRFLLRAFPVVTSTLTDRIGRETDTDRVKKTATTNRCDDVVVVIALFESDQ